MLRAILFDLGDTLIEERVDDISNLHEMTLHARPSAQGVLEHLSRRYRVGLVTDTETSPETSVRAALSNLGLASFFAAIVTSTDMGVTKPHRDMFLEALRRLGAKPSEAIMVGNDPERDIEGARRLGIITVLYRPTKYYQTGAESRADYVIDSLEQIVQIVDSHSDCGDLPDDQKFASSNLSKGRHARRALK